LTIDYIDNTDTKIKFLQTCPILILNSIDPKFEFTFFIISAIYAGQDILITNYNLFI